MFALFKRCARALCPPLLWEITRRCYHWVVPASFREVKVDPAPRMLTTREEVDAMVVRAKGLHGTVSYDAMWEALLEYHFQIPTDLPADPSSPEYREAQLALYRIVSGVDEYAPESCEQTPFNFDACLSLPHPYLTRSSKTIGEQLIAVGFMIRALDLPPPGRVLEFGPGYGMLTMELIQMGHSVTAVDISASFLELIRRRAARLNKAVETVSCGMLDYRPRERFDRVVFYESFHHCSDHEAMIARLDELVAEDGCVIFGGEPILDQFPMPWGLRLDGLSLYCIRDHGWMELGFRTDYFLDLLDRHGWSAERFSSQDAPWQTVFKARRKSGTQVAVIPTPRAA